MVNIALNAKCGSRFIKLNMSDFSGQVILKLGIGNRFLNLLGLKVWTYSGYTPSKKCLWKKKCLITVIKWH